MYTDVSWTRGIGNAFVVIVDSDIYVNEGALFTISPGVTVKLANDKSLVINGTLNASGTSDKKIIFTGTKEEADWWKNINIKDKGTATFNYCEILYGGYWDRCNIYKNGSGSISVSNSTIGYSSDAGIRINTGYSSATFANNTFVKNNRGVWLGLGASYDDTAATFTENGYDVYADPGTIQAGTATVWGPGNGNSVYLESGNSVAEGASLTIRPGTIVKFPNDGYLDIQGTLDATGTADARIRFTGSTEEPDWWKDILVRWKGNATFDYCDIWYGGYLDHCNIYKVDTGTLTISNSTIGGSSYDGILIGNNTGTVTITNTTFDSNKDAGIYLSRSNATVTGCTFTKNVYGVEQAPQYFIDYSKNTFTDNTTGEVHISTSGDMYTDVSWTRGIGNAFVVIVDSDIYVNEGALFTISPGVTVKLANDKSLVINGTLNASGTSDKKIIFTGTKEEADWWKNINIKDKGTATFNYCEILYGGYWDRCNIYKNGSGSISVSNSTIGYSSDAGIRINTGYSSATFANNTFVKNNRGVWLGLGASYDDTAATFTENGYDVYADPGTIQAGTATVWGPGNGNSVYLESGNSVAEGASLTIRPGTIVKFPNDGYLDIQGTLDATGTADARIRFTGSTEEPDWWKDILVRWKGNATFDYCDIWYGGYLDHCNIYKVDTGTLTISNSTIGGSSYYGILVGRNSGEISITNTTFNSNAYCGIDLDGGTAAITSCTFTGNQQSGVIQRPQYFFDYSANTFTGNKDGAVYIVSGTISSEITWQKCGGEQTEITIGGDITVDANGVLNILPGTKLKFGDGIKLNSSGNMTAIGTLANPITFNGLVESADYWGTLTIQGASNAVFEYCNFQNGGKGNSSLLSKKGSGSFVLKNSTFANTTGTGLSFEENSGISSVSNCVFNGNGTGIKVKSSTVSPIFRNCNITGNISYGLNSSASAQVDARINWWGDVSGPYHSLNNPTGKGDKIVGNVLFSPWKTSTENTATLTITVTPEGCGTTDPSGELVVATGSTTSVTATPAENYLFGWWELEGQSILDNKYSSKVAVTLGGTSMLKAIFVPIVNLTLAVSPSGTGTTVPTAGQVVRVGQGVPYNISAIPSQGYAFGGWTSPDTVTFDKWYAMETTATPNGNATVTANFINPVYLTMAVASKETGTTSPANGVAHQVGANIPVEISATPAQGYLFSGWSSTQYAKVADPLNSNTTVTLKANSTVTANFSVPVKLTLSYYPLNTGTTIPETGTYQIGNGIPHEIHADPYDGFAFAKWTIVNGSATLADTYSASTTVKIYKNSEVRAEFAPAVILTMAVSPEEAGATFPLVGQSNVATDVPISIQAIPNKGYVFSKWTASEFAQISNPVNEQTTVTITANATVTANFIQVANVPYTIKFSSKHNDIIKAFPSGEPGVPPDYDMVGKNNYSISLILDISATKFVPPNPNSGGNEASVRFTFGEIYEFEQTLGDFAKGQYELKFNKLKYDTQTGDATYAFADYDPWSMSENPPLRKVETFNIKWGKGKIKITITGKPFPDSGGNIFDFTEAEDGPLSGTVTYCHLMFGNFAWELPDKPLLEYQGSKKTKITSRGPKDDPVEFELMSWNVGPKKTK